MCGGDAVNDEVNEIFATLAGSAMTGQRRRLQAASKILIFGISRLEQWRVFLFFNSYKSKMKPQKSEIKPVFSCMWMYGYMWQGYTDEKVGGSRTFFGVSVGNFRNACVCLHCCCNSRRSELWGSVLESSSRDAPSNLWLLTQSWQHVLLCVQVLQQDSLPRE